MALMERDLELKQERHATLTIERTYMQKTEVYLCLDDDFDFTWEMNDVRVAEHMWNEGLSLADMAVAFNRDGDEVAILIMDRIRKGKIQARKGGAFGNRKVIV